MANVENSDGYFKYSADLTEIIKIKRKINVRNFAKLGSLKSDFTNRSRISRFKKRAKLDALTNTVQ